MTSPLSSWKLLSVFLTGAGVLHFRYPNFYKPMIPKQLGSADAWVAGSGVVEIAVGVGLAVPQTRKVAAQAAEMLFVGVFPGNIKMTADVLRSPRSSLWWKAGNIGRLPLQAPLVLWARNVAREAK